MVIQDRLYTVDEFETYAQAHPDKILELIDGRIVEKVTSEEHGKIVINIGGELRAWQKRTGIKGHYSTEAGHRLPDDEYNERGPDVSFRATDDNVSSKGTLYELPDFAVEIKSRKNTYDELREKAKFYIANGTHLVWLVYPRKRVVEVYDAEGNSEIYTQDNDVLSGEPVLPDFQMTLAEIFD